MRGIKACSDCGSEFRDDVVFKEGTYHTFMENVLNTIASSLQPNYASHVITIRDNALENIDEVESVVEALMDLTESVNTGNVLGIDREADVSALVEGIEKIVSYAKVLASRNEISERAAYRMAILEGSDPSTWSLDQLDSTKQSTVPEISQPPAAPQVSQIYGAAPGEQELPGEVSEPISQDDIDSTHDPF
jgi:hypothetical protein